MIKKRLTDLREKMKMLDIQAFILYGMDPHLSEYVSAHWQNRLWISGFTGSAGTVVVTQDKALLWTDFRYWIQAEKEISMEYFQLMKQGAPDSTEIDQWLIKALNQGDSVGVNGWDISVNQARTLYPSLSRASIELVEVGDLLDSIWEERPLETMDAIVEQPIALAGISREEKIEKIQKTLHTKKIDSIIISSLDSIAWLFNLRGSDIPFNPVARAYCLLNKAECHLFIDEFRLASPLKKGLNNAGCILHKYEDFERTIKGLTGQRLHFIPHKTPWIIEHLIIPGSDLINQEDILSPLQSCKNKKEILGIKRLMPQDCAALFKLEFWLKTNIKKQVITESMVAGGISKFRSNIEDYQGDSFAPISAYAANAALCHYESPKEKSPELKRQGILLLDSGGQYLRGTTDITRCFNLGNPSEEEKRDYTLVLKGHICLSRAHFPSGTRGYQLDILGRKALWDNFLDYGHGTGHGVGAYLNVHEGPQSISPRPIDQPLMPGMIVSNEPGLYREGLRGIRIENLLLVKESNYANGVEWLEFETLTLYPYEKELIDLTLLDNQEIQWINDYHKQVLKALTPHLQKNEIAQLQDKCISLNH
ncbi:MAG: aminopeptidase P family protein [Spirochaetaceae bacterium]|jgi:Xaa-Pro aminopeptidase|nr:aminopeptidase P family protein [Spirochaetaceae bacterium]